MGPIEQRPEFRLRGLRGKSREDYATVGTSCIGYVGGIAETVLDLTVRLMSQPDVSRGFPGLCVASAAWRVVSGVRYRVSIIYTFRGCPLCSPCGDPCFLRLPVYKDTISCVAEVRDPITIVSYLSFVPI